VVHPVVSGSESEVEQDGAEVHVSAEMQTEGPLNWVVSKTADRESDYGGSSQSWVAHVFLGSGVSVCSKVQGRESTPWEDRATLPDPDHSIHSIQTCDRGQEGF